MVTIIDYGMGNLHSVLKAFKRLRIEAKISANSDEISTADKLILPGVGHFKRGMDNLNEMGLIPILNQAVMIDKTPILGICLGMQLFSKHSEEGDANGLDWVDAETIEFNFEDENSKYRVPHIGWNTLDFKADNPLFKDLRPTSSFYFVHSFYVKCNDEAIIAGQTEYGLSFASSLATNNIFATQFHPEKSHDQGLQILKNFADIS